MQFVSLSSTGPIAQTPALRSPENLPSSVLNRVGGGYWQHPRMLMQIWLYGITGDQDFNDLRQRLRSRDDDQFRSALTVTFKVTRRSRARCSHHHLMRSSARHPNSLCLVDGLKPLASSADDTGSRPDRTATEGGTSICRT